MTAEAINLIPAPRRLAKACRTRVRRWIAGLAAFATVVMAAGVVCWSVWGDRREVLDRQIHQARLDVKQSRRSVHDLRRRLARQEWKLDSSRAIGRQPDWSIALALLAESLGEELVLERCHLQWVKDPAPAAEKEPRTGGSAGGGRFVFRLDGFGRSQAAVSRFALRLEKVGLFDRVRLIKTARRPFLSGKAVAFRMECDLQGGFVTAG